MYFFRFKADNSKNVPFYAGFVSVFYTILNIFRHRSRISLDPFSLDLVFQGAKQPWEIALKRMGWQCCSDMSTCLLNIFEVKKLLIFKLWVKAGCELRDLNTYIHLYIHSRFSCRCRIGLYYIT